MELASHILHIFTCLHLIDFVSFFVCKTRIAVWVCELETCKVVKEVQPKGQVDAGLHRVLLALFVCSYHINLINRLRYA